MSGPDAVADRGARVVVLLSGAGSTMAAVLAATAAEDYPAHIAAVGSDRRDAGGLAIAAEAGVPTFVVSPRDYQTRAEWNEALADAVEAHRPDIVLSAGFMRILDADFVARFSPRLINSHPALLPSFPGAHAVRDALAYGVAVTGATVHVVDAGVDTGPIIAQTAVPVAPEDDEATLHERIKIAERAMLIDVIARLATSTMEISGRRVVLA
jgi:phosphoribosylglycinamide formyltransferase-1